jgi:uncharacterized membrane protein
LDLAGLIAHIFFGTLGFGVGIGFDLLLVAVARTGRLETIRVTYTAARRYAPVAGAAFLLAIVLGFYLAVERHESLTSRWLLVTYVWLLIAGAVNAVVVQRRGRRILAALEAAGNSMTPELKRILDSATPIGAIVNAVAMLAIIGLMTAKPS